jgi:tetratricopeptide (TPR) repeat protein
MQSNEFQSLPQLSRPSTTGSIARAPSREINKALFSSVLTMKSTQDAKDFHASYNIKSSTLSSLAIGDIIDSEKIPVFHGKHAEYEDISTANKKSIATLTSSLIFKTLGKYDPSVSVDKSYVRKVKRPRSRGKDSIDDEEKNNKLSEALEMMAAANKHKNEASLSMFFSAGVIFDEINIHVKAVEAFKKAARVVSPEYIVDTFLLPDDSVHKRKVERLGGKPLADYLYKRALKRETLLRDETERQRLRRIVSYCQLLRLYIILQDYKQSQMALAAAFALCTQECEHNELLWYTHDLLKTNWVRHIMYFSLSALIIYGIPIFV